MIKQLFIIAGPNGCGKTTLAKEFLKDINLDFLNVDEIAHRINPENINSVKVKAGKLLIKKLNDYFQENNSFAVESTLSGNYLSKYLSKAKHSGYKTTLIYSFVDTPEMCIERIKARVKSEGHHIQMKVLSK